MTAPKDPAKLEEWRLRRNAWDRARAAAKRKYNNAVRSERARGKEVGPHTHSNIPRSYNGLAGPHSRGEEEQDPLDQPCGACGRPVARRGDGMRCWWCVTGSPRSGRMRLA